MVSLPTWLVFAALAAPMDVEVVKFTASACAPCQAMEPVLQQVEQRGFPVRRVDVDQHRALADTYQITSVPTLLVVSRGQIVDRIEGALPLETLLPRLESVAASANRVAPTGGAGEGQTVDGPTSEGRAEQLAVQATVRLRVEDANGHSFGTGTIVDVHGQDALVLTCGHIFRDSQGKGKIIVDILAAGTNGSVEGELIRYDLQRDLALVGVRTTAKLLAVPVAPPGWRAAPGQPLFSVGCNHGEDPSLMSGRLKAVNKYLGPENLTVEGLPSEGRSGGGLFSYDGFLVGVCNAADPELNEGLYAAFVSVHRHLDEARLPFVYQRGNDPSQLASGVAPASSSSPSPVPPPVVSPATTDVAATPVSAAPQNLWSPVNGAKERPSAGSLSTSAAGVGATAAEVICIIRTRDDPTSPSEVVVLDRPSRDFLSQLHEERRAHTDRLATQMRTPPATAGLPPAQPSATPARWTSSASSPQVPPRAAAARLTSERRLHRPAR